MEDLYYIYGGVRLNIRGDGACIPLLMKPEGNAVYIPASNDEWVIEYFQANYEYEDRIFRLDDGDIEKSQYAVGDIIPVVYWEGNGLHVISANSLNELRVKLSEAGHNIAREIGDILAITLSKLPDKIKENISLTNWPQNIEELPIPKDAKLWLEQSISTLRWGVQSGPMSKIQESDVRVALLSWAQERAEFATSPIFSHFYWAVDKAEQAGVYVEDLRATAILRRMTENIARKDRVMDLVIDFRKRYGRGPLSSVQTLQSSASGPLRKRAEDVLERYYEFVIDRCAEGVPFHILAATYCADSGADFPESVKSEISKVRAASERKLRSLLSKYESEEIEYENAKSSRKLIGRRASLQRSLEFIANSISHEVMKLDAYTKSSSSNSKYVYYAERFLKIDYDAMELSADYFSRISRDGITRALQVEGV